MAREWMRRGTGDSTLSPFWPSRGVVVVALLVCSILVACSSAPLVPDEEAVLSRTTFDEDREQLIVNRFPAYLIQPGDLLDVLFQIQTWVEKERFEVEVDHTLEVKFTHAPELNERQRVRPDGTISLPYLGRFTVIDKSIEELEEELAEEYAAVLRDPEIQVVVTEFRAAIKELKQDLHTAPRGLSRLAQVRPDGMVTFPLIGEMLVAGRTIGDTNREMNERYDELIPGLHVDLFLEKPSGSNVYVVGEVQAPGAYAALKPMPIMQAISLAKGYLPGARLDSVVVVRRYPEEVVATRVNVAAALKGRESASLFFLQPDDVVIVPKTRLAKAAQVAGYLAEAVMFRGWGYNLTYRLDDKDDLLEDEVFVGTDGP